MAELWLLRHGATEWAQNGRHTGRTDLHVAIDTEGRLTSTRSDFDDVYGDWAELREAQTRTLRLARTGQAVIIDIGEGRDIHPRNKYDVASRLVRWALAKDYGMKFPYRSPEYQSMAVAGNKVTVTLDCFGSKLRAFDVAEARGFAICGQDKVWQWANANVVGNNQVEVSHPAVPAPIAVRYAWADNPVCNMYTADGLPLTPFRTDDSPRITAPKAGQ